MSVASFLNEEERRARERVRAEIQEEVDALPRRVAHAVHALLVCEADDLPYGPFTAAEVCIFDGPDAFSPLHTGAALREARDMDLVSLWGRQKGVGLWSPTNKALDAKLQFETRFLRETEE